jgi:hypothetical protein
MLRQDSPRLGPMDSRTSSLDSPAGSGLLRSNFGSGSLNRSATLSGGSNTGAGSSMLPPRRDATSWKQYAMEKLHGRDATGSLSLQGGGPEYIETSTGLVDLPADVADAGTQSVYGGTVEKTAATIVTTADIGALIPIPDEALLQRCTLASLKAAEKEATLLLHHVQREISLQLQEAGVSYGTTPLDALEHIVQQGEMVQPRAKFPSRRQLEFHSGTLHADVAASAIRDMSSPGGPEGDDTSPSDRHWRFVEQQDNLQTYTESFARRAQGMGEIRDAALSRHRLFDDIDRSLKEQAEELRVRQETAAMLRRPERKDYHSTAQQLVARYGMQGSGGGAPTGRTPTSSAPPQNGFPVANRQW